MLSIKSFALALVAIAAASLSHAATPFAIAGKPPTSLTATHSYTFVPMVTPDVSVERTEDGEYKVIDCNSGNYPLQFIHLSGTHDRFNFIERINVFPVSKNQFLVSRCGITDAETQHKPVKL